jgi:hypothetical protein
VVTTLPGGDGRNLWPGAEDHQQVSVLGMCSEVNCPGYLSLNPTKL